MTLKVHHLRPAPGAKPTSVKSGYGPVLHVLFRCGLIRGMGDLRAGMGFKDKGGGRRGERG